MTLLVSNSMRIAERLKNIYLPLLFFFSRDNVILIELCILIGSIGGFCSSGWAPLAKLEIIECLAEIMYAAFLK